MIGSVFLAAIVVVTSPVLLLTLLAGALAAGYGIGRWRPWQRLGEWTEWQLHVRTDRWATRPRQAALVALLLLTDPVRTIHSWRHRNDPPPPSDPAPVVDPDWPANRKTPDARP